MRLQYPFQKKWPVSVSVGIFCGVFLVIACPEAQGETLHEAIEAAWHTDPAHTAYTVDATAARRNASAARSWFPGGPIVGGQYYDDHFIGSKVGYTTYQGSISVPLWLPGQGTATEHAAQADEKVAVWQIKVQRLAVATRVIELARDAAVTQARIRNLTDVRDALAHTVTDVQKACTAGEVSQADCDMAVAEQEGVEGALAEMQQALENIRADLEALTGRDDVPDMAGIDGRLLAQRNIRLDITQDPRLQLADAVLKKAQASYNVARHSYMPNPQVGVMLSRQEQYQSPWDTQIGVQFQVPLPSEAVNVPRMMQETQAVSRAERDTILARRKIKAEYQQLSSQLQSSAEIVRHARMEQSHAGQRAAHLAEAWKVGEIPVVEYLRARRMALEAADRLAQADVTMRATIARMILMAGHAP